MKKITILFGLMLTVSIAMAFAFKNNSFINLHKFESKNVSNDKKISKKNNIKFELINLPYNISDLEPIISEKTIELHYGKHLQTYVNNLNKLIVGTKYENMDLEEIVKESDGNIFNNAGQILNHNMYFMQFSKNPTITPSGKLLQAINKEWGSFDKFKTEFENAGVTIFGSGWVWLASDKDGKLSIVKEINAGNPITKGLIPILCFDVWEHAYYVDYQNRRADHLKKLWNIIDWKIIEERY